MKKDHFPYIVIVAVVAIVAVVVLVLNITGEAIRVRSELSARTIPITREGTQINFNKANGELCDDDGQCRSGFCGSSDNVNDRYFALRCEVHFSGLGVGCIDDRDCSSRICDGSSPMSWTYRSTNGQTYFYPSNVSCLPANLTSMQRCAVSRQCNSSVCVNNPRSPTTHRKCQ